MPPSSHHFFADGNCQGQYSKADIISFLADIGDKPHTFLQSALIHGRGGAGSQPQSLLRCMLFFFGV